MKLIRTKDGSFSAYNEQINESYHSISGALEEAIEKHVKPLNIEDGMAILDFCFGLGYNSIAALQGHKNLRITALENDLGILELMKDLEVPELIKKDYTFFSDLTKISYKKDERNNSIDLILGDAMQTVKSLEKNRFERVFFDPFSPSKQPEMWSEYLFRDIFALMTHGGQLSTYSCAGWIRRNMVKVGFKVIDGPVIGRRSPGSIAIKK